MCASGGLEANHIILHVYFESHDQYLIVTNRVASHITLVAEVGFCPTVEHAHRTHPAGHTHYHYSYTHFLVAIRSYVYRIQYT